MKILLVTTVFDDGVVGPATFANNLFNNTLFDCDILTENVIERQGVFSVNINQNWLKKKISIYSRIEPYRDKLRTIIDNYSIVLFNNALFAYGLESTTAKVVVMVNDYALVQNRFSFSKLWIINIVYRKLEFGGCKRSDLVLTNSKFLNNLVLQKYLLDFDDVKILTLGVKLKLQAVSPINQTIASPIKIIFVKNNYIIGGLQDLLKALSLLITYKFQLTIVGSQPPSKYFKNISNIKVDHKVRLPNHEVIALLQENDIYCVPSREEALGVANMEAMTAGIPVVTTYAGGIPEVITSKEGWIAPPRNPEALASQIKACIEDDNLRIEKIELAREKIKNFSKDKMISQLHQYLTDLASTL